MLYIADSHTKGGDLATYVASRLNSKCVIHNVEPLNFECLLTNITFHENKTSTTSNIYRPPPALAGSTECILSTINSFEKHNELIILGDFNNNWLSHSSTNDRHSFHSTNFTQLINEPTRVDPRSSSLLDWILVTNPERSFLYILCLENENSSIPPTTLKLGSAKDEHGPLHT